MFINFSLEVALRCFQDNQPQCHTCLSVGLHLPWLNNRSDSLNLLDSLITNTVEFVLNAKQTKLYISCLMKVITAVYMPFKPNVNKIIKYFYSLPNLFI